MLASIRTAAAQLLDVAFPPTCVACGRGASSGLREVEGFCPDCEAELGVFDEPVCGRCAAPLVGTAPSVVDCPACRQERWAFDGAVALGPYDGLLRRLVLTGKGRAGEAAMAALGRALARQHGEQLRGYPAAMVTSTPQHWRRRLVRRTDGVATLAKALADAAGLPFETALQRTRPTRRQTEVAPSDRRANVRGAFVRTRRAILEGRTVLLVDDVLTTGSTCHAASQALKRAGAVRVVAVVAAKRLGHW
ncbi:phosphoribosyltransferase family protein [Botrimarina mediterranea]|uniref:DNA utilization protein GntX n=1 Tax=Botrimarina mediterranea TaxID=2528022 RepID=A0A518K4H2_9BACT|nr:phosphoribosyltransferase family protein [Botrimarina mediterranea]QDV72680.1 DNA utilization protein GntX [Botrimarina mediterranea]QDV77252.1 DNA utilization protein GntX [Planctomycetes bacterium K2D]